jgi:DNA-binding beta-propeller fold protein YncE
MQMVTRYFMLGSLCVTGLVALSCQPQAKQLRATSTSINGPAALAIDGRGHLFVIEGESNRVMSIDLQEGTIATVAGNGERCCYQDGKKATEVSFDSLSSLATDGLGNVFLADGSRIRKIDMASGIISTVAGGRTTESAIEGASPLSAHFQKPMSLAVDAHGNLFIADLAQLFKLDMVSGTVHLFAGNGRRGFAGDEGPALDASFSLSYIAFDRSGNLIVSDHDNCRIRRIDQITGQINTIAVTDQAGDKCSEIGNSLKPGPFPADVAADAAGNIYFIERAMDVVLRIDAQTSVVSLFAGTGERGFRGDSGPATSAQLANPSGLAIDSNADVFIAEYVNNRIRRVDSKTGIVTTVAGNGLPLRVDLHP